MCDKTLRLLGYEIGSGGHCRETLGSTLWSTLRVYIVRFEVEVVSHSKWKRLHFCTSLRNKTRVRAIAKTMGGKSSAKPT
jgi:hypothetical protein